VKCVLSALFERPPSIESVVCTPWRSSVVEQGPFKPSGAFRRELPQLAKPRHFKGVRKFRLGTRCRNSPEIDNPSATRSDTRKSPSELSPWQSACPLSRSTFPLEIVSSNQASATKLSFVSAISANPATIRICTSQWRFEKDASKASSQTSRCDWHVDSFRGIPRRFDESSGDAEIFAWIRWVIENRNSHPRSHPVRKALEI
jgi:hypothetical protein